ncbi:MAG: glycosyltransferase [Anaerolineales bacterium]
MRLALVHDWLNQIGGAEDVLHHLFEMYPQAPVFTSIYDRETMPPAWQARDIRPLWLDRLPGIHDHHQRYLPLYPLAWGGLHLDDYDVILSNKSGFCHGFHKPEGSLHICYCLAPTRYVWNFAAYAQREQLGRVPRAAVRALLPWLRWWDKRAADRVDHFIAISTDIQARIQRDYGREAPIIYPPVDVQDRFQPAAQPDDYFLSLGRLVPYKRVDLVVEACTRLNLPLKVGGTGRDLERLQALAGPTVEFLGFVPDDDLPDLFARCRAFIFPGFEDFGITPVQAQACGRPVIAYGAGGALDTVLPGITGEHFHAQSVEALMAALQTFDATAYDPARIRQHALQFDSMVFRQQLTDYIHTACEAHGIRP